MTLDEIKQAHKICDVDKLIELRLSGMSMEKIADNLFISKSLVKVIVQKVMKADDNISKKLEKVSSDNKRNRGLDISGSSPKLSKFEQKRVVRDYLDGHNQSKLSKMYGVSHRTIRRYIKEHGSAATKKQARENNFQARRSNGFDKTGAIMTLRLAGLSTKEIAELKGIAQRTVQYHLAK